MRERDPFDPPKNPLELYVSQRLAQPPKPPKDFRLEKEGNALRAVIVDRARQFSSARRYVVRWAADVDTATEEGRRAGYVRSKPAVSIPRSGREGEESSALILDAQFQSGYFYCEGVNVLDDPSPEYLGPIGVSNEILDGAIPNDVEHFQVSESGEVHDGTVVSVLSFSYRAPFSPSFDGLQLYLRDYPNPGQMTQGYFHRYLGDPGGSSGVQLARFEVGRRRARGTSITVTNASANVTGVATEFLSQANAGDQIEVLGTIATIQSVNSNLSITLTGNWAGKTATVSGWHFIAQVRVFGVAISKAGTRRADVENAPYVDVIMDGLLSAPLAPANPTLTPEGAGIRGEFAQVQGVEIEGYNVYRSTGSADTFSTATLIKHLTHDPTKLATGTNLRFEDTDFTTYEKEQAQVFRYYVTTLNHRDQESASYGTATASCRLNQSKDGDPSIPARSGVDNWLYNAALAGTAGNNVAPADVTQDTFNAIGGPPAGWTRWVGASLGGAAVPTHQNGDEIEFSAPGAGKQSWVYQDINGWGAAAAPKIMRKGAILTFQAAIRRGAALADGDFTMYVEQLNAGANLFSSRRYRDTDSVLYWYATGNPSILSIPVGELVTGWQLFFAVFKLDDTFNTTWVRINFGRAEGTAGLIYIKQPMLSAGEELCNWTGRMVDIALRWPDPTNPVNPIADGPGHRPELISIP